MALAPKKKHEIPNSGSITVVIYNSVQAQNRALRPMQFTVVTAHLCEEDVDMKLVDCIYSIITSYFRPTRGTSYPIPVFIPLVPVFEPETALLNIWPSMPGYIFQHLPSNFTSTDTKLLTC